MALLSSGGHGVLLVQAILGDCTIERWAEICQTKA